MQMIVIYLKRSLTYRVYFKTIKVRAAPKSFFLDTSFAALIIWAKLVIAGVVPRKLVLSNV
jgi:hypothetical protein